MSVSPSVTAAFLENFRTWKVQTLNGLIHPLNTSSMVNAFYEIITHFNNPNKNISHEAMSNSHEIDIILNSFITICNGQLDVTKYMINI